MTSSTVLKPLSLISSCVITVNGEAVLEVVGKAHALLEIISERADSENKPEK